MEAADFLFRLWNIHPPSEIQLQSSVSAPTDVLNHTTSFPVPLMSSELTLELLGLHIQVIRFLQDFLCISLNILSVSLENSQPLVSTPWVKLIPKISVHVQKSVKHLLL